MSDSGSANGRNPEVLKKIVWLAVLPGLAAASTPHWSVGWLAIVAVIQTWIVAVAYIVATSSYGVTRKGGVRVMYLVMDTFGLLAQIPLFRVAGITWWQVAGTSAVIVAAVCARRRAYLFFERRRRSVRRNSRPWLYLLPIGAIILGDRILLGAGQRAVGEWILAGFVALGGCTSHWPFTSRGPRECLVGGRRLATEQSLYAFEAAVISPPETSCGGDLRPRRA